MDLSIFLPHFGIVQSSEGTLRCIQNQFALNPNNMLLLITRHIVRFSRRGKDKELQKLQLLPHFRRGWGVSSRHNKQHANLP